jgi:hypothetical protein
MHINMYLFFKNLNILCIFSDWFFDPVFFRFRFLGLTGSVLVTLVRTDAYIVLLASFTSHINRGSRGLSIHICSFTHLYSFL